MEIKLKFLMKYQWKSIGNPVKIEPKFKCNINGNPFQSSWNFNEIPVQISKKRQLKSNGYPVENSMKYKWKSIGNPVVFNSNFNGIPVGSIVNPVEISIIYQWKFQWNVNRY